MNDDRFIPMDELPFLKRIARQMYLNSLYDPYRGWDTPYYNYNRYPDKQLPQRWLYEIKKTRELRKEYEEKYGHKF